MRRQLRLAHACDIALEIERSRPTHKVTMISYDADGRLFISCINISAESVHTFTSRAAWDRYRLKLKQQSTTYQALAQPEETRHAE